MTILFKGRTWVRARKHPFRQNTSWITNEPKKMLFQRDHGISFSLLIWQPRSSFRVQGELSGSSVIGISPCSWRLRKALVEAQIQPPFPRRAICLEQSHLFQHKGMAWLLKPCTFGAASEQRDCLFLISCAAYVSFRWPSWPPMASQGKATSWRSLFAWLRFSSTPRLGTWWAFTPEAYLRTKWTTENYPSKTQRFTSA